MLSFQNTNLEIENEIIDYFSKSPYVGWLVSCDGQYNLMVVTWVKDAVTFDNFFTEFLKKYSQYIQSRDVIIILENHASRKAYLFHKKINNLPTVYYSGKEDVKLDSVDLEIIKILSNNTRIPLYKIASKLNLSAEAISYRIKQLKKKEIIQAFRPIINTILLGYQYYNVLFRLKNFQNILSMFRFFKLQPNIIYFVKYLGEYDIGIDLEVKDATELREILRKIKDIFSIEIRSYNSILIYQEHKLSYSPE